MKFCQCGCGLQTTKRFIKGHNITNLHKSGTNGSHWKGGKMVNSAGYILIQNPRHPFSDCDGYIRLHRFVWETYNKAMLLKHGVVHHINGDKTDNRIENLQAMMKYQHDRLV